MQSLQARIAVVLVVLPTLAGGAMAGDCGFAQCWGAVGIGPGGAWAYSYGKYSETDAVNALQGECEWDCDNVQTFYNTCGAIAEGSSGNWGFGWADTCVQAEENALGYCYQNGGGCSVRVWACSP